MSKPTVLSGKLVCGADCEFGEHVVVDVAEEVVLGDRCTVGDGAVFSGRRVEIGSDFYGYSWSHPRSMPGQFETMMRGWLDVGRGRKDDEDAVLKVGARCTFHDCRIDLARAVTVGDDVGLSPEVWLLTHHYWMSPLDGYPRKQEPINICSRTIVYSRSLIAPGCSIGSGIVIGAQSVCSGKMMQHGWIYGGNPAVPIRAVRKIANDPDHLNPIEGSRQSAWESILTEYRRTLVYRGIEAKLEFNLCDFPKVRFAGAEIDCEQGKLEGTECRLTDDLRWHLFRNGLRCYTKRRFRKMGAV